MPINCNLAYTKLSSWRRGFACFASAGLPYFTGRISMALLAYRSRQPVFGAWEVHAKLSCPYPGLLSLVCGSVLCLVIKDSTHIRDRMMEAKLRRDRRYIRARHALGIWYTAEFTYREFRVCLSLYEVYICWASGLQLQVSVPPPFLGGFGKR